MDYTNAMKKAVKQSNEEQKALVDRYDRMNWEKRFDETFIGDMLTPTVHCIVHNTFLETKDIKINGNLIKLFISALLTKRDKDLIKQIEKLKKEVQKEQGTFKYDWCFDDIIKLLK
jgi:hypothetical protein